ncbi:HSP20-like chaperone [Chytriomyces sp. MP71]|nr:HSP20-like chaperone [Chytriomyces sp. MP71]
MSVSRFIPSLFDAPTSDLDLFSVPTHPYRSLMQEMMLPFRTGGSLLSDAQFKAHLDMQETADAFVVTVDVPGFEKNDIKVSLKDDLLTVSGARETKKDEIQGDMHIVERRRGSFNRSVRFPMSVKTEKIAATMNDGVLEVTVLKKEPKAEALNIDIQ